MNFDLGSLLGILDMIFAILREVFGIGAVEKEETEDTENEEASVAAYNIRNV